MSSRTVNYLLAATAFLLFAQCQPKQQGSHARVIKVNGNKITNCNISEVTDTIDLPLSDIIKTCEVIPLETTPASLFESIYHVGISENYIAIHSRGRYPIKLFSRDGKFIRDIGKIGRGPGEFSSLYGIQLDEAANKLYLTPFARAKELIVYSLDNENLSPIPLAYQQTKCWAFVENDVVTILSMPFEKSSIPVAYQQDINGNVKQEVAPHKHQILRPDFSSEVSSTRNSEEYDIFILSYGSKTPDTLYYYNTKENRLDPKFTVSFNGEKHSAWLYDWRNYYWAWVFGNKYKGKKVLVNKKTLKSDFFRIRNDYYGGYEINKFYTSNNGMFISSVNAIQLIEMLNEALKKGVPDKKEKKRITELLSQIKEDDNEILFIGEMK